MVFALKSKINNLDKPEKPIHLNLFQLQKAMKGFQTSKKLKVHSIKNGKPTVILVWVTTHPPCLQNFPLYEILADMAEEFKKVNFIFLDYNPDVKKSEEPETLAKVFGEHDPGLPIFTLDLSAPPNEHPDKQFESFIVPEFIMLDTNHKVVEHFVLNDRVSFRKALLLVING